MYKTDLNILFVLFKYFENEILINLQKLNFK